jgi:uncharacterized protein
MEEFEKLDNGFYVSRRYGKNLVLNPKGFKWAIVSDNGYDSLISYINGKKDYDKKIISKFKSDKILNQNCNDCYLEKENRKKNLAIVVLHTTDRCSLDCKYCYTNANKSKEDMPLEISKKTIDRIVEYEPIGKITLEFHGGEPTLRPEFIESTVGYANQFKIKGKSIFRYSIQTNAINIFDTFLNFLKDNNFAVGVSLDGPKDFHNKNRIYPSGKGSFDDVIKTISRMKNIELDFSTICVVNDPKVLNYYPGLMIEHGIKRVKFNPYFEGQGRAKDLEMPNKKQVEFAEEMLKLSDRLVKSNSKNEDKLSVGNLSLLIKNLISDRRGYMCMRFPCGAGISMIGIDTNGDVYSCEEMNGNKELVIGNVNNSNIETFLTSDKNKKITERKIEQIGDCADCFAVDVCAVNCANKSYAKSKDFYSKTASCQYYKTIIPELLWKIYKNPEIIKKLS